VQGPRGSALQKFLWLALLGLVLVLAGCGYNALQGGDEQVVARWSEVLNQYQRRADLVPNLVRVVQAESQFEQQTLTQVVQARVGVMAQQSPTELLEDAQAFARYQQAQTQLGGALARLLAVSENYPSLRANQGYRDLQAQLEGTENRIAVARQRYILAVRDYNVTVRSFPINLTAVLLGYGPKPNLTVDKPEQLARPPAVGLDTPPSLPRGATTRAVE